jgi:carbonic anhydrase
MFPRRLTDGYRNFLSGRFDDERARYRDLADQGQRPDIMVIGCIDSRVSPEVIFDAAPGEILVARNVANLVPHFEQDGGTQHGTSAALEFAVVALDVRHVVVLGHALCGGIRAYANEIASLSSSDFIGRWMSQIAPAAAELGPRGPDFLTRLELASVALSLRNLMTFPWIQSRVEAGSLALHGAYFGVATGQLLVRNAETGEFTVIGAGRQALRCDGT